MFDCIIVGGGPAGLTAALYLARYRRQVVVIDGGDSRARYIPKSHNCPGFPEGIAGKALLKRMRVQAEGVGVVVVKGRVLTLKRTASGFVASDGQNRWRALRAILATGIEDALPSIRGMERAIRSGVVRLCPVCDAYEAIDRNIAILGQARTIVGHAKFLRTYSERVTAILATRETLTKPNREALVEAGIPTLSGVSRWELAADGCIAWTNDAKVHFDCLYIATGSLPKADLDKQVGVRRDRSGHVIVNSRMRTSVKGLYAIGDGIGPLNQVSVAVGQAAIAATAIHRSLSTHFV